MREHRRFVAAAMIAAAALFACAGSSQRARTKSATVRCPHGELRADLAGRVVDQHGQPISGAIVHIQWSPRALPSNGCGTIISGVPFLLTTAADGRFSTRVPRGPVLIRIDHDDELRDDGGHVYRSVELELILDHESRLFIEPTVERRECRYEVVGDVEECVPR